MTEQLFDVDLGAPLPEVAPLSAGRRLTARQHADVAAGRHPLTKLPLLTPQGVQRCGTCAHRTPSAGDRFWPKCDRVERTSGPATDCRAWWPACIQWEAKP